MTDNAGDRLSRTIAELIATLDQLLGKRDKVRRRKVILTKGEIKVWKDGEPSFNKPVAKRLSDDSYRPSSSDEDLTEPLFKLLRL